jgi:hypothetical protein
VGAAGVEVGDHLGLAVAVEIADPELLRHGVAEHPPQHGLPVSCDPQAHVLCLVVLGGLPGDRGANDPGVSRDPLGGRSAGEHERRDGDERDLQSHRL